MLREMLEVRLSLKNSLKLKLSQRGFTEDWGLAMVTGRIEWFIFQVTDLGRLRTVGLGYRKKQFIFLLFQNQRLLLSAFLRATIRFEVMLSQSSSKNLATSIFLPLPEPSKSCRLKQQSLAFRLFICTSACLFKPVVISSYPKIVIGDSTPRSILLVLGVQLKTPSKLAQENYQGLQARRLLWLLEWLLQRLLGSSLKSATFLLAFASPQMRRQKYLLSSPSLKTNQSFLYQTRLILSISILSCESSRMSKQRKVLKQPVCSIRILSYSCVRQSKKAAILMPKSSPYPLRYRSSVYLCFQISPINSCPYCQTFTRSVSQLKLGTGSVCSQFCRMDNLLCNPLPYFFAKLLLLAFLTNRQQTCFRLYPASSSSCLLWHRLIKKLPQRTISMLLILSPFSWNRLLPLTVYTVDRLMMLRAKSLEMCSASSLKKGDSYRKELMAWFQDCDRKSGFFCSADCMLRTVFLQAEVCLPQVFLQAFLYLSSGLSIEIILTTQQYA